MSEMPKHIEDAAEAHASKEFDTYDAAKFVGGARWLWEYLDKSKLYSVRVNTLEQLKLNFPNLSECTCAHGGYCRKCAEEGA